MSAHAITEPRIIPAHVPPHLVWDHDLLAFQSEGDDPFKAVARLHEGPEVIWVTKHPHGQQGWYILPHKYQQDALVDFEHFSSKRGSGIGDLLGTPLDLIPLEFDPPKHTAYRKILNPLFTPAAVRQLEGPVRATCDRLIANFEDRGGCEFVSEFAIKFPSYIFLSLVGLPPEMLQQFLKWEEGLFRGHSMEERVAAGRAVYAYLENFIQEQRKNPTTDLLRALLNGEVDGRPMTDHEILGALYTFYVGGLDTVYSTIGWTMHHLARNPDLQTRLRNNLDLLPQAVDEFGRAFSVVATMRHVAADVDFHGVPMREGDLVVLPLYASGRDPKAYANPHEIDFDRRSAPLTFASGPHTCLGRQLARRELRIALEAFLTRFDNIHVPEGEKYEYHAGVTFGVDRLPLAWTRR